MRAILLLETDFNSLNEIIYNHRVLLKLKANRVIPYKLISSRKGQSSQYIALNKKLIYNIVNQMKRPMVVISANMMNCYDCITYSAASLSNQHFRAQLEYLLVLFFTIQTIKIFLRTSFGVSSSFYTGSKDKPFQGAI